MKSAQIVSNMFLFLKLPSFVFFKEIKSHLRSASPFPRSPLFLLSLPWLLLLISLPDYRIVS